MSDRECFCDGTQHQHRRDYCPRLPVHDPNTSIERRRHASQAEHQPKPRLCFCGAPFGHDWSKPGPIGYCDALREGKP